MYIFQTTVSRAHAADAGTQKGLHLLEQILPSNVCRHYVLVMPPTEDIGSATLTSVNEDWIDAVDSFLLLVLE